MLLPAVSSSRKVVDVKNQDIKFVMNQVRGMMKPV